MNTRTLNIKNERVQSMKQTSKLRPSDVILILVLGFLCFCGALWLMERSGSSSAVSSISDTVKGFFDGEGAAEKGDDSAIICVEESLADDVHDQVSSWVNSYDSFEEIPAQVQSYTGDHPESCSVVVSRKDEGNFDLVWKKYYVVVASESSALSSLTTQELYQLLGDGGVQSGDVYYSVAVESGSLDALDRLIGTGVGVAESTDVITTVAASPHTLGIVPFELLSPKVKEISVDGTSLRSGMIGDSYPLIDEVWVDSGQYSGLFERLSNHLGEVNYDPELVRTVVVTGTTVVGARGWYSISTANGDWNYPLLNVAEILQNASIAHISNEASRVDGCVQPHWTLVFCGPTPAYDAITWAGIDVVGLTGNHILDYGAAAFNSTLDWYDSVGIKYFGGGRNSEAAHTPVVLDLGTIKIAFVGYNMIPPAEYYATATTPGSAQLEETALRTDIARAKELADFVFVDMQWGNEYERTPNSYQTTYGHIAVDAGADVVSGVHPHWIQPLEYYGDGLIFYGLGNFLFDQTWSQETREGVMIRHYFYGNEHTGFEIIPTRIDDTYQLDLAEGLDKERITRYVLP